MNDQKYNKLQQSYDNGYNNHCQPTYLPQYGNMPNNQQYSNNMYQLQNYNRQQHYHRPKRICPVCGGVHFVFRDFPISNTSILLVLLGILLLLIPIIGWILGVVVLAHASSSTIYTFATCTQCGYRENVQLTYNEYIKKENEKIKKIQKEQVKKYKELKKLEKQNKRIQKKQLREARKKDI